MGLIASPPLREESTLLGLLTGGSQRALDELRELNPGVMTPIQAFDALRRLKDQASSDT